MISNSSPVSSGSFEGAVTLASFIVADARLHSYLFLFFFFSPLSFVFACFLLRTHLVNTHTDRRFFHGRMIGQAWLPKCFYLQKSKLVFSVVLVCILMEAFGGWGGGQGQTLREA